MKTIKIMIISLLLVASQAFAWGKGEQKALLGFTAGVVLTHFVSNYNSNSYESTPAQTVYVQEPTDIVYVDRDDDDEYRHYERRYNRYYYRKYRRHHHHRHNRVVVQNNYQTNYYY